MTAIYNNPQATARRIRDGWLLTGDIGKIDEEGNVFLLGNKKDMIISKGQNIFPRDIVEVLSSHPKVAEVAVVGMPDETRGQIVRAVISLKAGETATEHEIKHFCLERLANYKVPKQIIFTGFLPKTAAGKIDRNALKELQ